MLTDRSQPDDRLARECEVYSRYLLGRPPSDYAVRKYVAYHQQPESRTGDAVNAFDRLLLRCSRRSPILTSLVDSYASRFFKSSVVRRKIVLTLAILECSPPACELVDATDRGPLAAIYLRFVGRLACYAGTLVAAMILFGPVHVATHLAGSGEKGVSG